MADANRDALLAGFVDDDGEYWQPGIAEVIAYSGRAWVPIEDFQAVVEQLGGSLTQAYELQRRVDALGQQLLQASLRGDEARELEQARETVARLRSRVADLEELTMNNYVKGAGR
jgi:hypothetical protein